MCVCVYIYNLDVPFKECRKYIYVHQKAKGRSEKCKIT